MNDLSTKLVISSVLVSAFFLLSTCSSSPEQALQEFYVYDGAEDELMDPLILAGSSVVPLVVHEVDKEEMPRRLYAISFLGNGGYHQALPVLRKILFDSDENEHFRAGALVAIYQIDQSEGRRYEPGSFPEGSAVQEVAKDILQGKSYLTVKRTYFQALVGFHE